MANWQQFKQYVHSNYVVSQDLNTGMKLEFQGDGRSQLVFLGYQALAGGSEGWVTIESPVGRVDEVNLREAVAVAGKIVCGGLGAWGEDPQLLMLRHALPLENLDTNEFERPLQLVMSTADQIESMLTGEDRF